MASTRLSQPNPSFVSLGHRKGSQLNPGSSEAGTPKVLSTPALFPYPLVMTQRSPGSSATRCSESLSRSSTCVVRSSVVGAHRFIANGYPRPNCVIQADGTRVCAGTVR